MLILIATDGSEQAELGARLVGRLEWPENTTFRVVTAVEDEDPVAVFGGPHELVEAEIHDGLEGPVARAVAAVSRPESQVDRAVLPERAGRAILTDAAVHAADLIVVGHRGGGLRALLGSVATQVVEGARVPVLVARADKLGPVVLGDDGSPQASAARQVIALWPALRGLPVRVLSVGHVTAPLRSGISPTMRGAAAVAHKDELSSALSAHSAIAEAAAAELRSSGVAASAAASIGDPARTIVAAAEEMRAGLIVVGSRGRGGIAAMIGSVARAVVLHARCSVLVVHAPQ